MFEHLLDGHKSPAPIDSAKVEDTGEPTGWKLVPIEPTHEMLVAAAQAEYDGDWQCKQENRYQAMLAAAPALPVPVACPECGGSGWTWKCTCTPMWTGFSLSTAPTTGSAPVAWLVTGGKTFVDKPFLTEAWADKSIAKRKDSARKVPLYDHPASPAASVLNRSAFSDIVNERIRQTGQWGGAKHDDTHGSRDWFRFIAQQQEKCRATIKEALNQQDWGNITNAYGEELIREETRMRLVKNCGACHRWHRIQRPCRPPCSVYGRRSLMSDVKLTGEELDALTKERFGNMHQMYYDGFRRLMRDAIKLNAKKDATPTHSADGESLRPVAPKYDPATQPGSPEFDGAEAYQAHLAAMYPDEAARATAEQQSVPSTHGAFHTGVMVKLLLDSAFEILRPNSPEDCPEEPHMRVTLGKRYWEILDGEKK